jgi:hypothetical protein
VFVKNIRRFWYLSIPTGAFIAAICGKALMAPIPEPHQMGKARDLPRSAAPEISPAPGKAGLASADSQVKEALAITDRLQRSHRLEDLGAALGDENPDKALNLLQTLKNRQDRAAFLRGLFYRLASADPKEALTYAHRLTEHNDIATALTSLLDQWRPETDAASRAVCMAEYGVQAGLGMELLSDPADPALAAFWAGQIPNSDGKATLLARIAVAENLTDPKAVSTYGNTLQGSAAYSFYSQYAKGLGERQPGSALAWSNQIDDPVLRVQIQGEILPFLARTDPAGALASLAAMPSGSARDSALEDVLEAVAERDPSGAAAWAQQLSSTQDQAIAAKALGEAIPVASGIAGITLLSGQNISTVGDTMGAAKVSGQIEVGDRILGVAESGADFQSTEGMSMHQIAKMVRGQPGTTVQLQIAPATNGGFGPPHVVTLTRGAQTGS